MVNYCCTRCILSDIKYSVLYLSICFALQCDDYISLAQFLQPSQIKAHCCRLSHLTRAKTNKVLSYSRCSHSSGQLLYAHWIAAAICASPCASSIINFHRDPEGQRSHKEVDQRPRAEPRVKATHSKEIKNCCEELKAFFLYICF